MNSRALLLLLLLPAVAFGQRGMPRGRTAGSHMAIPTSAPGEEATELLARRLSEAELPDYLKELLKKSGGIESATALKLLEGPFAKDILKRLTDGDPTLMKLVEAFAAKQPELKGLSSDQLKKLISDKVGGLLKPGGGNPEARNALLRSIMNQPTPAEREQMARQAYTERLNDTLRDMKMDGMMNNLRDSPAFQNWMQALGKNGALNQPGPLTLGDTMHVFGGFDQLIKRIRPFLPKELPALNNLNIQPPNTPTLTLPSFGLDGISWPSLNLSGNWPTTIVLLLVSVTVVMALWQARITRLKPIKARANLGPWPVDPRTVSTRQEVIAAFEYLALLKCGSDAAHWHHHAVANDLGRNPGVRADAESLAALYEQARYAPPDRPGSWESARNSLGRLAGSTV